MKQELRTLNVSIRAAAKDDAFELHGTAVSYNVLSQDLGGFVERIAPGCFTRSLASGSDVKMLFNHSQNHVLGRTANGTLQLFDTPEGLNFCCKLDPNQQAHRDLHSSIKRGDISECSFAFRPDADGESWEDVSERGGKRYTRRTVKSAQLFDASVVTTPAYGNGATKVVARSGVVIPTHEKSLEEKFFETYGRWPVTDQDLRMRLGRVGAQIRREAAELMGDEQLRARVEEVGRRIRIEALIAEMEEMVNG
jgi:uncharacterized protein